MPPVLSSAPELVPVSEFLGSSNGTYLKKTLPQTPQICHKNRLDAALLLPVYLPELLQHKLAPRSLGQDPIDYEANVNKIVSCDKILAEHDIFNRVFEIVNIPHGPILGFLDVEWHFDDARVAFKEVYNSF
jgi:hypothetical protein